MASKGKRSNLPKLQSITTADISRQLKEKGGDNTEFFYLYVSTSGREQKKRQPTSQVLPQGQRQLPFLPQTVEDPVDDDDTTDSDEEDDEDITDDQDDRMDSQDHQDDRMPDQDDQGGTNLSPPQPSPASLISQSQSLKEYRARREKAMNDVHKKVLPSLLDPDKWEKVFDKDTKLTYRALYFNIIKKYPGEEERPFIQRVGKIRHKIAEEVQKFMVKHRVNFKINSLLSKPFLYDEEALEEQTMKATQPSGLKQGTVDDHQQQ